MQRKCCSLVQNIQQCVRSCHHRPSYQQPNACPAYDRHNAGAPHKPCMFATVCQPRRTGDTRLTYSMETAVLGRMHA